MQHRSKIRNSLERAAQQRPAASAHGKNIVSEHCLHVRFYVSFVVLNIYDCFR